jgi:hypothetical protein
MPSQLSSLKVNLPSLSLFWTKYQSNNNHSPSITNLLFFQENNSDGCPNADLVPVLNTVRCWKSLGCLTLKRTFWKLVVTHLINKFHFVMELKNSVSSSRSMQHIIMHPCSKLTPYSPELPHHIKTQPCVHLSFFNSATFSDKSTDWKLRWLSAGLFWKW